MNDADRFITLSTMLVFRQVHDVLTLAFAEVHDEMLLIYTEGRNEGED